MDAEVGGAKNTCWLLIERFSGLCRADWCGHEADADEMVSQLHGGQRAPTFFSSETASLADSLSVYCFDRLQLELPDYRLAHGLSTIHRSCDQSSGDYAGVDLRDRARFDIAVAARSWYFAVITNTFCRDCFSVLSGRLCESFGVLLP